MTTKKRDFIAGKVLQERRKFLKFLDQECEALGLIHRYQRAEGANWLCGHIIEKACPKERTLPFLGLKWTSAAISPVAEIVAEPYSPIRGGSKNTFQIKLLDDSATGELTELVERFRACSGFYHPAEII